MAGQREIDDFVLDTMPESNGVPVWKREVAVTAKSQIAPGGKKTERGSQRKRQRQRENTCLI